MSDLPVRAPHANADTERFWAATDEGRIELPRCGACDLVIWYPRSICPDCSSADLEWITLSGRASVYSYTIIRGAAGRTWGGHTPYVLAYVALDEGPIVMTNVVECDPEAVEIDMPVVAVFDDTGEGSALVRFRPA